MRKGLFFALPAIWTYGFSSLSSYTSLNDVFSLIPLHAKLANYSNYRLVAAVLARLRRGVFYTETSAFSKDFPSP